MSPGSFKIVTNKLFKNHKYPIYMYKKKIGIK